MIEALWDVYEYDEFDECRRLYRDDFMFCTANLYLYPKPSSIIWNKIQEYSQHPRHYDRRTKEVGQCFPISLMPHNDMQYKNISNIMEAHLSEDAWQKYKLNSSVEVMECLSTIQSNIDFWRINGVADVLFICCFIAIILMVLLATAQDKIKSFYILIPAASSVVKAFSLAHNIPKLMQRNRKSMPKLDHLDGIRTIVTMIILLSHSSIPLIKMPLQNVAQIEMQFDNPLFSVAMAVNTYMVQLFFVLGGFLLAVTILDHKHTNKIGTLQFLWMRIKHRLIRILPPYLFVILFHASWYPKLIDGPIGYRFKDYCVKNWWTNILFLNNYIHPKEPCIQFAWYLGADFQLYLIGTILMILIIRNPNQAKIIYITMVLFALSIPAITIYVNKTDATVIFILRYILQEIRTLPYYIKVYIPFETNAGNYFFGMLAGNVYFIYKNNDMAFERLNLNMLFLSGGGFFVMMNFLTILLPEDHLVCPSIVLAIFGTLLKCAWGVFPSILILYLAFKNPPSRLSSILCHPLFGFLSKFSFTIYLVQYGVVYTVYRHVTYTLMYNSFTILYFTVLITSITLSIAFLLHTCLELPLHSLFGRNDPGQRHKQQ
ncbi:regulator of hypoxia-inducible factor 1-like isoform X2 [Anopheles aquasalis]|uniref:regulator of hypoxia-inducible factor 1-like isoform X2 n=1 Tax=Anopheles aquasalis TaxID=42839 RepID=UPI00215AA40A|nr:regulator of hypoxia-inducible factor 1-like isoform X2 [Anopheles aquasalis]